MLMGMASRINIYLFFQISKIVFLAIWNNDVDIQEN